LNAKEQQIYHKNHEVSVILAQTGFEIFISEILRTLLKSVEGLSDDTIINFYRDSKKLLYFRRKLNRLDKILQKNRKGRFKGTIQYKEWEEKTYNLRNEIVHEGKRKKWGKRRGRNAPRGVRTKYNMNVKK